MLLKNDAERKIFSKAYFFNRARSEVAVLESKYHCLRKLLCQRKCTTFWQSKVSIKICFKNIEELLSSF